MSATIFLIVSLLYFNNLFTVLANGAEHFDEERSSLFILEANNKEQKEIIEFLHNLPSLDVWKSTNINESHTAVGVLVPDSINLPFKSFLELASIKYEEMDEDINELLKHEREERLKKSECAKNGSVAFNCYMSLNEINKYLDNLAATYPDRVRVFSIGRSFEGRDLRMLHISNNFNANQPAIIVEGGIHAREWISPAQVLYIIHQLVENQNEEIRKLTENVDWYIIPVANPDGYVYSHLNNRLWRRSRATYPSVVAQKERFPDIKLHELYAKIPDSLKELLIEFFHMLSFSSFSCVGVDLNRNWDSAWKKTWSCFDMYSGLAPFSESETKSFANFAKSIQDRTKLYLSFHSFGQKIQYPYRGAQDPAQNEHELKCLGNLVNDSMKIDYRVGNNDLTEYPVYGSSDDWFKSVLNVTLSYTIELPPRDRTLWGRSFILDPNQIRPVVDDMFKGVQVFGRYVAYKYTKTNFKSEEFDKCNNL